MTQACCALPQLTWITQRLDGQYVDQRVCSSCEAVIRTEKYAMLLRFPRQMRCINCGGELRECEEHEDPRCVQCGLAGAEDKAVHDQLAALHPDNRYLITSKALQVSGRRVLALKLASAEIRWGTDPVAGMLKRIQILEELGEVEQALEEAYEWSDLEGCPVLVFGVIAQLMASLGDLDGAVKALERGLVLDSVNHDWWTDYAELMNLRDDRENALRGAVKGMNGGATEARCIAVIADIAERYYAGGQFAEAGSASSVAGKLQERYIELAWLRVRMAASAGGETAYLVRWLKATLAIEPDHAEALQMMEPYIEKPKRGILDWF